jgi:RNA polymerase sigma-70 factor (ECF subfamily)
MEPDTAMHEEELATFRERMLASLPERCRSAYLMVREEGFSYGEAAARLGITRRAVHMHVVDAQRRFREELPQQGVAVVSSW